MANVAIITALSIRINPFLKMYSKVLGKGNYDLIYWDRHGYDETDPSSDSTFCYSFPLPTGYSKTDALRGYLGFARFVSRCIDENKYDKLIVLQVQAGVIIWRLLRKKYCKRFILDIRDYSYEKYRFFRVIESDLIRKSYQTVISSKGFEAFLPKHDYVIVHNSPAEIPEGIITKKPIGRPIVITYLGFIHYIEQNKRLIDLFANDDRFIFRFIGEGSDALSEYVADKGATNVIIRGAYTDTDLASIYSSTDVVSNAYGNNDPLLDYALSNKLYYSIILRKPILVSEGTYTASFAKMAGLGFEIDFYDPYCKDKLISFLDSLNMEEIDAACEMVMHQVDVENETFKTMLVHFSEKVG